MKVSSVALTCCRIYQAFHEDCITSGYRHPRSSATDCVISVFQLTNETLNFWTHFLPTWYFLWKLLTVVCMRDVWTDSYMWPWLVFLLSCCLYPLASSCAHTFSVMSIRSRHICFFFDYGALSLYSLGSAIAYSAYIIPDAWVNSIFHIYYVPLAVCNTVISTTMACSSRFHESKLPRWGKMLRVSAFTYPYIYDNIPLFYRIFICDGEGCTANKVNSFHVYHVLLAFLTGFLFASHLPERLAPGRFDYVGHSHQLFHVCGVLATHFQMKALEMDMELRQPWLQAHAPAITFSNTLGAAMLCIAMSLMIIYYFSHRLLYSPALRNTARKCSDSAKRKHKC